jgi:hypothetical protein
VQISKYIGEFRHHGDATDNRERAATAQFGTDEAFRVAAEAIESAIRRGDPLDGDQGRHLVISAAAFHLAGYAARSFSMLPPAVLNKNLASPERALACLLRRDLGLMREQILVWHSDAAHSDDAIAGRLLNADDEFGPEDAVVLGLTTSYYRGLGMADTALLFGSQALFDTALTVIQQVVAAAATVGNIPLWWVATLTAHLMRDPWNQSLFMRLPSGPELPERWGTLRRDFIAQLSTRRPPHIELGLRSWQRRREPSIRMMIWLSPFRQAPVRHASPNFAYSGPWPTTDG